MSEWVGGSNHPLSYQATRQTFCIWLIRLNKDIFCTQNRKEVNKREIKKTAGHCYDTSFTCVNPWHLWNPIIHFLVQGALLQRFIRFSSSVVRTRESLTPAYECTQDSILCLFILFYFRLFALLAGVAYRLSSCVCPCICSTLNSRTTYLKMY